MGVLSINTDTTDELVAKLSRTGTSITGAKDTMDGGFFRLKGSERLYGGIGKISNNFSIIGDRFNKLSRNISKHSNEIVETDLKLSKIADDIIIPDELKTVDSAYNVEVNATVLTKTDGKSVKTGDTEEQVYDDTSGVTKEDKLENINKGAATESELDAEYSKEKKGLDDISKASDTSVNEVDDETLIKKTGLEALGESTVGEMSVDDTGLDEIKKEELDSVDNDAVLEKEELATENFDKIKGVDVEVPDVEVEDILKYLS